jgi:hypothetical protein
MHNAYKDITSRLGTPQWYDEYAVPRYDAFKPNDVADIYANQVALLLIACQSCGQQFKVAISSGLLDKKLSEYCSFGYGDPPNADCCGAGATMTSDTIAVLEFYKREWTDWIRVEELEGVLVNGELYKNKGD